LTTFSQIPLLLAALGALQDAPLPRAHRALALLQRLADARIVIADGKVRVEA
jgi:hypothetical protein